MMSASMDMDVDGAERSEVSTEIVDCGRIGRYFNVEKKFREYSRIFIIFQIIFFRDHLMGILDGIDREVEGLRKHALKLQEKRDQLNTRIDMLKTVFTPKVDDMDEDEMNFHLKRVNDRLQTVQVQVQTIRDDSQVESVHVINNLIDEVIKFGDPIEKRKKCQQYLNSCSSSEVMFQEEGSVVLIDKKFETHLLSCALDDQKLIRKRLEALMLYMMKQMVTEWGTSMCGVVA